MEKNSSDWSRSSSHSPLEMSSRTSQSDRPAGRVICDEWASNAARFRSNVLEMSTFLVSSRVRPYPRR